LNVRQYSKIGKSVAGKPFYQSLFILLLAAYWARRP